MPKFTAYTAVHGGSGTEFFAPGDEVPEWAEVGAHVTDADAPAVKAEPAGKDDGGEPKPERSDDAPDFTAPAKPTRGRPRKSA